MRALPNPNLRIGSEWRPDAPTRDFDRVIPRADGRDHQVKSLLSVPARPSAWTLSHPARRNDWASLQHLDRAVGGDVQVQQVHPADAGRDAQAHPSFAPGLLSARFLGQLPVQFEDSRIGGGAGAALEPVEHLRGRVDLVVVPAFGECRQLVQILGQPRC